MKKKIKKQSTTSRPHIQKIPWVFPRIPRRRTRTGPEIEPEEPPRPSKIPELPFSLPPLSQSSKPFLEPLSSRPSLEKIPKTFWIRRFFKALLKVEPDKPVRMPRFPTLRFPPLYTRFAIMKTYTAVSDANGKITVTFPRVFRKIPGVVLTPNDPGTWFEHILSKNEFGFTVQILKTSHAHQHANSGGGGSHSHGGTSDWGGTHSHVIRTGGSHWHSVSGTLDLDLYRSLALVTAQVGGETGHTHSNPNTGAPSSSNQVLSSAFSWGSDCAVGGCISAFHFITVASSYHTHAQGSTGGSTGHTHDLNVGSANFVYDADISIGAWTSDTHGGHDHPEDDAGCHDHVIITELAHNHSVPDSNEKEASALPNTSVTFTYFAQEETV